MATPYILEFYEDTDGREAVLEWLRSLSPTKRRAIGVAMHEILAHEGPNVVNTEYGKALGGGLYEFRLRHTADEVIARAKSPNVVRALVVKAAGERVLLRVFFHVHGAQVVLLLAGYDKGRFPSRKRQQQAIISARERLAEWQSRG
jgi:hypothetical protein